MTKQIHQPVFQDRIHVPKVYTPGGNLAQNFKKLGWVPPSEAALQDKSKPNNDNQE